MNRHSVRRDPRRDVDEMIRHIKALVHAREVVRRAGASDSELTERSAEIQRLQCRLAHRVRRAMQELNAQPG